MGKSFGRLLTIFLGTLVVLLSFPGELMGYERACYKNEDCKHGDTGNKNCCKNVAHPEWEFNSELDPGYAGNGTCQVC